MARGCGASGADHLSNRGNAHAASSAPSISDMGALRQQLDGRWSGGHRIDAICRYAMIPTGKLFRPRLLLASCAAVGGSVDQAMPAALGAECAHSASLIHDDIIDADAERRGRPSVCSRFGSSDAIASGDMLIFDLFLCLSECAEHGVPASRIVAATRVLAAAGVDVCRGQSLEAEIHGDLGCDIATYILVARLKTAAFFRGVCEAGAILGGGSAEQAAALASYGDKLGVAYQVHDDLLCYSSATSVMGKSESSDVRNKRPTLPVILACIDGDATVRADIEQVFAPGLDDTAAHKLMSAALQRSGALDRSGHWATGYARSAVEQLGRLPESPGRDLLAYFAEFAVTRNS